MVRNVERGSAKARASRVLLAVICLSQFFRGRVVVIRYFRVRRHVLVFRGIRVSEWDKAADRFRPRHVASFLARRPTPLRGLRPITNDYRVLVEDLMGVGGDFQGVSVAAPFLGDFPMGTNGRVIFVTMVSEGLTGNLFRCGAEVINVGRGLVRRVNVENGMGLWVQRVFFVRACSVVVVASV